MKKIFYLIIFLTVFYFTGVFCTDSAEAALSCTVTNGDCQAGETSILRMSGTSNAHAGFNSTSSYSYRICCKDDAGVQTIGTSCSGNYQKILYLANPDNSHVEKVTPAPNYSNNTCISVDSGTITCGYEAGNVSCGAGTTCLASIRPADGFTHTNAHIGDCSAHTLPSDWKICCGITESSTTTTTTVPTTTTTTVPTTTTTTVPTTTTTTVPTTTTTTVPTTTTTTVPTTTTTTVPTTTTTTVPTTTTTTVPTTTTTTVPTCTTNSDKSVYTIGETASLTYTNAPSPFSLWSFKPFVMEGIGGFVTFVVDSGSGNYTFAPTDSTGTWMLLLLGTDCLKMKFVTVNPASATTTTTVPSTTTTTTVPSTTTTTTVPSTTTTTTSPSNGSFGLPNRPIIDILLDVVDWLLGRICATVALLMIIIGGVMYLTSTGDEMRLQLSKKIILYAIVGLLLCGISYMVVKTVFEVLNK